MKLAGSVGAAVGLGALLFAQAPPPRAAAPKTDAGLKPFNHKVHLALGNVAPAIAAAMDKGTYLSPLPAAAREQLKAANTCQACHHGLEQAAAPPANAGLRMADCLVCHNKIDPPDSCAFCHTKDAQLRPASHTPDFLDSHTNKNSGLDYATCAVCHGRKFTCMGCHLAA